MYYLQNKYQDSDWLDCEDVHFPCKDVDRACRRARKLSEDSVRFGGMTRVLDKKGKVIGTYSAGRIV